LSGYDNVNRPSSNPDLGWYKRNAVVRQVAGGKSNPKPKDDEQSSDKKLGHSLEKETQTMSPNASNINHG
jgi:hypothetical protein